jgi:hypothetical protein
VRISLNEKKKNSSVFPFSSFFLVVFDVIIFHGNVFIHYPAHQNCRLLIEVDYKCWSISSQIARSQKLGMNQAFGEEFKDWNVR